MAAVPTFTELPERSAIRSGLVAVELDPVKHIYEGCAAKNISPKEVVLPLFIHPLQVQVLRLDATLGVRLRKAVSGELNLSDLLTWYPPAAAAVDASNKGLALPGMLTV